MQRYSLRLCTQSEMIIIDTSYFYPHNMKGTMFKMRLLNLQDVLNLKKKKKTPDKFDVT